jgi:hypothetical protein
LQRYLAEEVDRRGRTWAALGADMGDNRSASTIRSYVQAGVATRPQRTTLAMVDRLMGWEAGSARTVLEGGEPRPRPGAEHPTAEERRSSVASAGGSVEAADALGDALGDDGAEPGGPATPALPALAGEKWERLSTEQQRAVLGVIDSMLDGDP